jgi:hypothetical protein
MIASPLLVVLAAATVPPTYYEANVSSFACTSIAEVHRLQGLRADTKAFQMALIEKQVHGECFAILKGTVVEGEVESSDAAILRVNRNVEPPGFEAPLKDFQLQPAAAGK